MQRCDYRHLQAAQQSQKMAACRSAEDTKLVLNRHEFYYVGVKKTGGAPKLFSPRFGSGRFFWGRKPNDLREKRAFEKKRVKPTIGFIFARSFWQDWRQI